MRKVNMNTENKLPVPIIRIALVVVIALIIMFVFLFHSGIMAKYVHQAEDEPLYVAENFYFESDYLKPVQDNGEYVSYTLQTGVKDIVFELRNYEDELRSSEVNIEYEIYLDHVEQNLNDIEQAGANVGKLIVGDAQTSKTITLSNLKEGTYLVTAVATSPYEKTIGASFIVSEDNSEISYTAYGSKESPQMLLTVQTNDYSGKITLSWDAQNVYPDKTDPMLENAVATTGNYTVEMLANSEYTFRFFKSDLDTDYTSTLKADEKTN